MIVRGHVGVTTPSREKCPRTGSYRPRKGPLSPGPRALFSWVIEFSEIRAKNRGQPDSAGRQSVAELFKVMFRHCQCERPPSTPTADDHHTVPYPVCCPPPFEEHGSRAPVSVEPHKTPSVLGTADVSLGAHRADGVSLTRLAELDGDDIEIMPEPPGQFERPEQSLARERGVESGLPRTPGDDVSRSPGTGPQHVTVVKLRVGVPRRLGVEPASEFTHHRHTFRRCCDLLHSQRCRRHMQRFAMPNGFEETGCVNVRWRRREPGCQSALGGVMAGHDTGRRFRRAAFLRDVSSRGQLHDRIKTITPTPSTCASHLMRLQRETDLTQSVAQEEHPAWIALSWQQDRHRPRSEQ